VVGVIEPQFPTVWTSHGQSNFYVLEDPSDDDSHRTLLTLDGFNAHMVAGNYDDTSEQSRTETATKLKAAVENDPQDATAHLQWGELQMQEGDLDAGEPQSYECELFILLHLSHQVTPTVDRA
jgi:hypothetical protein